MSLYRCRLTREQFCFGIQLRVDLDTHGQFPILPGGLLGLFAQLLLCLESFSLLLELLAEGDAVCRGGLETASRRETSGINLGASQEGPIDPAKNADSAAGPWPEHEGGIVGGAEAVGGFKDTRMPICGSRKEADLRTARDDDGGGPSLGSWFGGL
jgi:hypothetical protein